MTLSWMLVFLSLLPSGPPQQPREEAAKLDFEAMRRDLETMKRILEREAPGRVPAQGQALFYLSSLSAVGRGPSEAFYLPGEGALFLLRVSEPVAGPVAQTTPDGGEAKEPTLWEEVRAEVDGRPLAAKSKGKAYDAQRVESRKSGILEALAKYGANIGQLSDDQHLTVVVTGEPAGGPLDPTPYRAVGEFAAFETAGIVAATGRDATVMTIRVSRADASAFAAGRIDIAEFRKRAKVGQY